MKTEINEILSDPKVLEKYEAIDEINQYPFSHGMKHINNTFNTAKEFAKVFSLPERETYLLKICVILHDLGQVDGREHHAEKAAVFAREYLSDKGITNKELEMVCSAIETHDEKKDYSKLKYPLSFYVNLIDKTDFSKNRLEDNCLEKYGWFPSFEIEHIEPKLEGKTFKLILHSVKNKISEEILLEWDFFNKVTKTFKAFCTHFELNPEIWLDEEKMNIEAENK